MCTNYKCNDCNMMLDEELKRAVKEEMGEIEMKKQKE